MLKAYYISVYVQFAGSIIICISCLLFFNKRALYIKSLGIYALGSVLFSVLQEISRYNFWARTNFIGNGFVLSEALLLSMTFYFATESTRFKRLIVTSIILYTFFYVITFLLYASNSYSFIRFGRDSLMIFYAVTYFYYLIRKLPEENLLMFPMFWINASVIFFFCGTFVLSLMAVYIVSVLKNNLDGFWTFRNFFRFAFCCVLSYAGWLDWRLVKLKEMRVTPKIG